MCIRDRRNHAFSARFGSGLFVRIADGKRADALEACIRQNFVFESGACLRLEILVFDIDPAGAEPQRGGRVRHIADCKRAVFDRLAGLHIHKDENNGGRAVKRIAVVSVCGFAYVLSLIHI